MPLEQIIQRTILLSTLSYAFYRVYKEIKNLNDYNEKEILKEKNNLLNKLRKNGY